MMVVLADKLQEIQMAYALGIIGYIMAILVPIAAWLNHIIYCFSHEAWGFLIAGAIFFPIGIFHGIYLWF